MSAVLEKLRRIIIKSDILPEEQNDLLVLLPILPEEAVSMLVQTFEKNPQSVREFNENFKVKVRAISVRDSGAWDEIIRKEEEMLEKASKGEEE